MIFLLLISVCIFGLLVGSFLNVVALRFNTGRGLNGRSCCFSCGTMLSWRELIPLFSWLYQKGRCRHCSSSISIHYFFGEITTSLFFVLIAARGFFFEVNVFSIDYILSTLFLFVLFSVLIVVLLYDMRHKIIPDKLSILFGLLSFLSIFFFAFRDIFIYIEPQLPTIEQILGGIIVPLPFILLWIFSKGRWIGLGDPKLMVGMGFLFGINQGFSIVFLSFWIGGLFVLSIFIINLILKKRLLRLDKKSIMKEELPFAPFLIIATLFGVVFNIHFF